MRTERFASNAVSRSRKVVRRSAPAVLVLLLTICMAAAASPALAQESDEVDRIEVTSSSGPGQKTTLTFSFDSPIPSSEAEAARTKFAGSNLARANQVETLGCNKNIDRPDENGLLTLQFSCFPEYGAVAWGYRLSPQVQATVVGPVAEDGLRWWRNSAEQPKGAPHSVPADYLFHGTMRPVFVNDTLDYQDLFTFRHNIGPGGTARLTFAGSLGLTY